MSTRRTSFGVSVSSVSPRSGSYGPPYAKVPSAVCGNSLPTQDRPAPQVAARTSPPNFARPMIAYAPTTDPYETIIAIPALRLMEFSSLVRTATPIGSLFLTVPCPVTAASSELVTSTTVYVLVAFYFPAMASYFAVPAGMGSEAFPL